VLLELLALLALLVQPVVEVNEVTTEMMVQLVLPASLVLLDLMVLPA
jgi:hypothetical protein